MCEEIIGEDTVMDVVPPGDTNTELVKETLADILPSDLSYVLEMIEGITNRFKADFYLNCLTQAEATNFVEAYCNETREVLRSASVFCFLYLIIDFMLTFPAAGQSAECGRF